MDGYALSPGSKYRVRHGEDGVTEGILMGIAAMGSATALVFMTDDGLRYVNSALVETMDLLESSEPAPAAPPAPGSPYYG